MKTWPVRAPGPVPLMLELALLTDRPSTVAAPHFCEPQGIVQTHSWDGCAICDGLTVHTAHVDLPLTPPSELGPDWEYRWMWWGPLSFRERVNLSIVRRHQNGQYSRRQYQRREECKYGHPMTEANTYVYTRTRRGVTGFSRICRTCNVRRAENYRKRHGLHRRPWQVKTAARGENGKAQ